MKKGMKVSSVHLSTIPDTMECILCFRCYKQRNCLAPQSECLTEGCCWSSCPSDLAESHRSLPWQPSSPGPPLGREARLSLRARQMIMIVLVIMIVIVIMIMIMIMILQLICFTCQWSSLTRQTTIAKVQTLHLAEEGDGCEEQEWQHVVVVSYLSDLISP